MLGRALDRVRAAADLLRPRTFFRTLTRVDPLVDATRELRAAVQSLQVQTDQLLTIQRLDWEKRDELQRLGKDLDVARIDRHVSAAVEMAILEHDPFPHVVVNDWLPPHTYRRVLDAMPPPVFFANREQHWAVLSGVAPEYARVVWAFVANTIVGKIVHRALNEKFRQVVGEYVRSFCPALPQDVDLTLHPSDGRIMLRRPGYTLTPHRDPKWGFVTGLAYLARDGDSETYGTQLYRVRDDEEAPSGSVFYVDQQRCELVTSVPFRANTLLAFLNSAGAHGASIPSDAQPAALERYLYQFRLGPTGRVINRLLPLMPPGRAALWAGAKTNRAAHY